MKISDLYDNGPLTGKRVFIVGSGPSMSVFDRRILRDELCVLLNDSSRYFPELGPVAMSNNRQLLKFASPNAPIRVVKGRLKFDPEPERDDNHCAWDDPNHYVFSYREPPWDKVSHHDERTLFKEPCHYWAPRGGSISHFAVQFALWCKVESIVLVGCDCNAIGGQDYTATKKPRVAQHDYHAYQHGLMVLGQHARKRGIPMVSMTPFFGLKWVDQQFEEMQAWLPLSPSA